jgi:hydroxypyruvate reductase
MIIQNFTKLASTKKKRNALEILEAGLYAAMPKQNLKKIVKKNQIKIGNKPIPISQYENIYLIAFGKAADSMAKTVNSIINIKKGIIVMPKGSESVIKNKKFQIFKSSHPLPNNTSVQVAKTILQFLKKRKKNEFVIFLVSGGASALLALPNGITLKQKIKVTKLLLKSGATIQEINCIRKHLSKIKGGKLIEGMNCSGVSLVMSDVMGDDLSSIASGTTYYDKTTFRDAFNIIKKYNLAKKLPKPVIKILKSGSLGKIPETPKKQKIKNYIISSNSDCLEAMAKKSKKLGLSCKTKHISGNVKDASKKLVRLAPKKIKSCVIFGGETTVHVIGNGVGGRNQELVLRILQKLQKKNQTMVIASLGTDGIDGNSKYAGALSENISANPKEIKSILQNNNSESFFKKYGGLIKTGTTKTNLMDIGLLLN